MNHENINNFLMNIILLKIEGGGEIVLPPFLALNLRKTLFFYYSMEAYIVHLATGIRIFGQSYIVIKVIY
jgi:hypothetical protein